MGSNTIKVMGGLGFAWMQPRLKLPASARSPKKHSSRTSLHAGVTTYCEGRERKRCQDVTPIQLQSVHS